MLPAIRVGLLRFVGTWAGTSLLRLQTETTGQAVVALAPTRARLMPSDLLDASGVDTLATACCSPCPWACRGRRDLSSTGSSGILILGGPLALAAAFSLPADLGPPVCTWFVLIAGVLAAAGTPGPTGGRSSRPQSAHCSRDRAALPAAARWKSAVARRWPSAMPLGLEF